MKRIVLSALAALPLAVAPVGVASAHSGGGTTPSLSIQRDAQFDLVGTVIHVGLYARCTSSTGDGSVVVDVKQYPPETPYPASAGSGPTVVVCDGKSHSVGVSIIGEGFDAGTAYATAKLVAAVGQNATASKQVNIIVMK
jgi:hypothetical protein